MLPSYRIAEVAIYSVLNLLPFMLLALYPFRRQLRFSMAVTLALAILLVATHISIGLLSALHLQMFCCCL